MFSLAVDGQYLESPGPDSHGHGLTPMRYMSGLTPLWATGATGLTPYSFEANPFDASFAPRQSGRPSSPLPSFDFDALKRSADDEAEGAVLKRPRLDQAGVGISASTASYAPDADTPSDRGRRASSPPTGSSVAPTPKALLDLPEPTPPMPMHTSVAPGDISSAYAPIPAPAPPAPAPPVALVKSKSSAKAPAAKAKKTPAPRKSRAKGKAKAAAVAPELAADADEAMDDDAHSIAGSSVDGAETGKRKKRGGAPEEDKRKHFLERNRKAACKSRARRKEFIRASPRLRFRADSRAEGLEDDASRLVEANTVLNTEISALRDEVASLRASMLTHVDCLDPSMQDAIRANQLVHNGPSAPVAGPSHSFASTSAAQHDDIVVGASASRAAVDPRLAQPDAESVSVAA